MEVLEATTKRVYKFGDGTSDGRANMKPLLGGKGANLAEMSRIGLPVPPGFTITTDVCTEYQTKGEAEIRKLLSHEIGEGLDFITRIMQASFGDEENPLLLSVRSGARDSMPGMMDTVLDIGLNDVVVEGLVKKSGKPRFAWDSYRRFIQMYGDVVMKVNHIAKTEHDVFETIIENLKIEKGVSTDQELQVEDLQEMVRLFKERIKEITGEEFPQDPKTQLWNSIIAVFESWHTPRAVVYRQLNDIPEEWGTAVNVQAMVYGNMSDRSASGVAFTRDAATGENIFNGEYLINAQGEDVVSGVRTPHQISTEASRKWAEFMQMSEEERKEKYISLEEYMPEEYRQLLEVKGILEEHFRDMQDLEFTVQEDKLWILQTRNGKRTGTAMVKIGMDMLKEKMIDEVALLQRVDANKINELLHPKFDPDAMAEAKSIAKGLPASPGAATGQIVFSSEEAASWKAQGKDVILVRVETSPEDLAGMNASEGILTARGGMTSHAAVVARGMGKCCVTGAGSLQIDFYAKTVTIEENTYSQGDWISVNGSTGDIYEGKIDTVSAQFTDDFVKLIGIADGRAKMKVRANADTPETAQIARDFGAQGIGLCRTEHMFFDEERIAIMREMIMADTEEKRKEALDLLLPAQRKDFEDILRIMEGYPVTIRLLDPPLHEFLPQDKIARKEMARLLELSLKQVDEKIKQLKEVNPMLGHRGCRLGNTYPEITRMQTRAIIEAAMNLKADGVNAIPEIMIPLVGTVEELSMQVDVVHDEIHEIFKEREEEVEYKLGTMIEVPRAALVADQIAAKADFFSFGTNDLTQMTYGYSRDDVGKFLPIYLEKGILKHDPFEVLDQSGVGQLVTMGVEKGRRANTDLHVGICGEHGGEPRSIEFCGKAGMDYVSCSPFRVPIAKVAAAKVSDKMKAEN